LLSAIDLPPPREVTLTLVSLPTRTRDAKLNFMAHETTLLGQGQFMPVSTYPGNAYFTIHDIETTTNPTQRFSVLATGIATTPPKNSYTAPAGREVSRFWRIVEHDDN